MGFWALLCDCLCEIGCFLWWIDSGAPDEGSNSYYFGIIIHIFTVKHVFVAHHWNRLVETVLIRGHNICFY